MNGIEEVTLTHIELPLDAEGVPIRPGDKMTRGADSFRATVKFSPNGTTITDHYGFVYAPCDITHAKPDPVEELLIKFQAKVLVIRNNYDFEAIDSYSYLRELRELVEDYTELMREVLE